MTPRLDESLERLLDRALKTALAAFESAVDDCLAVEDPVIKARMQSKIQQFQIDIRNDGRAWS